MKLKKSLRKAKKSSDSTQDNYEYDDHSDHELLDKKGRLVSAEDDESIDDDGSEVGWNEDDEAMFGQFFGKKRTTAMSDDDDNQDDDDQEEAAEGEMLLSDLIAGSSGASVSRAKVEEDEQSESEDEEDEEDIDNETHAHLMQAMDKFSKPDASAKSSSRRNKLKSFEQAFEDSPFSGIAGSGSVTMDQLFGALSGDTVGVKSTKSKLLGLNKSVVPKFVEKVHSERIERGIVYEDTRKDMDKWKELVQDNRHIKTLDLSSDMYHTASSKELVQKYEPMTDMEKEIQMVLVRSHASEAEVAEREDELVARVADKEELAMRQAELSKVRALMFYEQQKRHRINKIKSKLYRKIRKRQKDRREGATGDDSGADDNDEGDEANDDGEFQRVKERMDLRHKNTGKWAKMALTHSKADKTLRQAYHESIQLGHELAKKVNEVDESDAMEEDERLDDVLNEAAPQVDGRYKKLLDMGFMKRAADQQRERAREEAQGVLRELRAMEADSDDDDDRTASATMGRRPATSADLSASIANVFGSGSFNLPSSKGVVRVNGNVTILPTQSNSQPSPQEALSNPWLFTGGPATSSRRKKTSESVLYANIDNLLGDDGDSAPAETVPTVPQSSITSSKFEGAGKKRKLKSSEAIASATAAIDPPSVGVAVVDDSESRGKTKKNNERKPLLMQKSQEDLVQMAFAGPDYEEDFAGVKRKAVDDELEVDEKKNQILSQVKPGWGDWAGPGLAGISKKTLLRRDIMLKAAEQESQEKRKNRKDSKMYNVVLSDRRIKTASKYKLAEIPHPFTTREEYERSIQMPLGGEWNATHIMKKHTMPEVITRAGKIIEPIAIRRKSAVV